MITNTQHQDEIRKAIDGVQAQTGAAAATTTAPAAADDAAPAAAADPAPAADAAPAGGDEGASAGYKSLPSVVSWTMYK